MAAPEINRNKNEAPLIDLGPETEPVSRGDVDDKGGGDSGISSSFNIAAQLGGDENPSMQTDIASSGQSNTTSITSTDTTATTKSDTISCEACKRLSSELEDSRAEVIKLQEQVKALGNKLETNKNELEREVQRRCELEQKFTEEAKRSTDQISELISKSNQDDARLSELRRKFEDYSNETSTMIESFTTNREVLSSQLLELRQENDYLLGKFLSKSRDLQNESINLPQTVDELQFHCLTLNEKLILATLAKEQLEDVIARNSSQPMN